MKTVLVTGHEGLVGRYVWPELENLGFRVKGIDLRSQHKSFQGDICKVEQLEKAMQDCHGVIHFAAVSRVVHGQNNPDLCWRTNAKASRALLDLAVQSPLKPWVLVASSREVYGESSTLPVKESTPLKPVNIYGRSKKDMEAAAFEARKQGLNTAVVRLANVYGCILDHPDRVLPAFCRAAVLGEPLRVDGGQNTFDFTHISDVAKGVLRIVELLDSGVSNLPALHLLPGIPTTLELATKMAIAAARTSAMVVEAPPRKYDVSRFVGCPELARKVLGWRAAISPQAGITMFVEAYKKQLTEMRKAI
jgi:nucleoside-diphosphate-sugar epimerase